MTSLSFNGGQTPTRTIPKADTSHGKVLYAMYLYGSQTAVELINRTGYLGAQERANELLNDFYLPIQKGDTIFTRPNGRTVPVKTYGINWQYISLQDLQYFIDDASALYGNLS